MGTSAMLNTILSILLFGMIACGIIVVFSEIAAKRTLRRRRP